MPKVTTRAPPPFPLMRLPADRRSDQLRLRQIYKERYGDKVSLKILRQRYGEYLLSLTNIHPGWYPRSREFFAAVISMPTLEVLFRKRLRNGKPIFTAFEMLIFMKVGYTPKELDDAVARVGGTVALDQVITSKATRKDLQVLEATAINAANDTR